MHTQGQKTAQIYVVVYFDGHQTKPREQFSKLLGIYRFLKTRKKKKKKREEMVPLNYHLGKTPGADSNDSKLAIKPDTKSG